MNTSRDGGIHTVGYFKQHTNARLQTFLTVNQTMPAAAATDCLHLVLAAGHCEETLEAVELVEESFVLGVSMN